MSNTNMDAFIDNLAEGLTPCKRLAHPLRRALPWVILALVYTAGAAQFIGLRPDLAQKFADPVFLFETGLMLAVSLSAFMASCWLCVPDMRGAKWIVATPVTMLAVFVFWTVLRLYAEGFEIPALQWDHCLSDGALMGFVPAAAVIFLGRAGATTRPCMMALMNVAAAGALGYIGLRFTCALDTAAHSALYHLLPFVVMGAVLGAGARRVFRW
ncbi:MAG TPA: hypothetical protein DEA55_11220 [Rhodospirillaceae bacterium]|nr:hypothetical protein [Rhodospirillaceae bacterium]